MSSRTTRAAQRTMGWGCSPLPTRRWPRICFGFQNYNKANAPHVKHLTCKAADPSLIPRTHVEMEVEKQLQKHCPLTSTHALWHTCPSYTYNKKSVVHKLVLLKDIKGRLFKPHNIISYSSLGTQRPVFNDSVRIVSTSSPPYRT